MFPITDAARAGDIRMRRRRALALLAGVAVLGTGLVQAAMSSDAADETASSQALSVLVIPRGAEPSAAPRSATGDALVVNLPCAGSVKVMPRSGLSRRVLVSAAGGAADDGIRLVGGATISLAGGCRGGAPDVTVAAPASMPLTIVQTGHTDLRLGAFSGPVTLTQAGSGDMVIGDAGELTVSMTGGGDLAVGHLHGNLRVNQAGGGDVRVENIQAADVALNMIGGGDAAIAAGHIARLRATLQGGDLRVGATIGDATIQAGAASDVSLPRVTGHLTRNGAVQTTIP